MWTVPGNVPAKYEVPSFNRFGVISTYFPKIRGHVTLATPTFRKNFKGSCPDCPWELACQKLKSVALNVLVLDSDHHLHYKIDGPKFTDPRLTAVSP